MSSASIFEKIKFSKNSFMNTSRFLNSLDPDQALHFVRPDLDPNCFQRISADDTCRQRVNENKCLLKIPKGYEALEVAMSMFNLA